MKKYIRKSKKKFEKIKYPFGSANYKQATVYSLSFSAGFGRDSLTILVAFGDYRLKPKNIKLTLAELKAAKILNERALSRFVDRKLKNNEAEQ